ncbi:hypothetical protein [Anaeromyxobacter oryzisoli]|uniref:hypothetical protein n=1 Tax=Anaeromyxobacter oryzisoli TaxID=2925408 RepID=UPI001F596438|nr:hypothetical protein [Anaeromyxobacter sp. SG63]
MNSTARGLLLFLHVLSASAWLGAALWVPGDVRRTLARGHPHVEPLAERVGAALGLDLAAGLATVVTGLALWGYQGFAHRAGIELGFAAAIVRLLVGWFAVRPAWGTIQAALAPSADLAAADPPARRLGMLAGIAHLLWLVALAGMISG